MLPIKFFFNVLCVVFFLCLEIHGNKHYCDSDYDFNSTPKKDDPHPQYGQLSGIDKKFTSCGPNVPDIREITLRKIKRLFTKGKLTSALLTACYLKRIRHMNPFLNAVIEINPDAMKQALKSDYERFLRKKFRDHEDMHGIPILIKDNIATRDSMQTCSGSLALVGYKPSAEATVVTLLRKAGAVILGKSNLSEFANFRGTNIPNGWSSRGNQTHNCYFLHVDPFGSSTGSAVAVAANLCAAALGTETDGSIVAPSDSACVVGFKPSLGCVSSQGVIPIASSSQDVVGPMARTVVDATTVYNAISRCGPKLLKKEKSEKSSTSSKKIRVGYIWDPFWISNASDHEQVANVEILRAAINKCGSATNLKFVEIIGAPDDAFNATFREKAIEKEFITLFHEFKTQLNDYLKTVKYEADDGENEPDEGKNELDETKSRPPRLVQSDQEGPPTLKHVIEFNEKFPAQQGYNQEILERADAIDGMANETYTNARTTNVNTIRNTLDGIFKKYDLDAIAAPGISTGLMKNLMYRYFAIAGYPYIIVPVKCSHNKPLGLVFHGLMDSDAKLLTLAKEFEKCVRGRHPPSFQP